MARTAGSLNRQYMTKVRNPILAHNLLMDIIDSRMDRGLRLRHSVNVHEKTMIFEHHEWSPIRFCYQRLKDAGFIDGELKRVY